MRPQACKTAHKRAALLPSYDDRRVCVIYRAGAVKAHKPAYIRRAHYPAFGIGCVHNQRMAAFHARRLGNGVVRRLDATSKAACIPVASDIYVLGVCRDDLGVADKACKAAGVYTCGASGRNDRATNATVFDQAVNPSRIDYRGSVELTCETTCEIAPGGVCIRVFAHIQHCVTQSGAHLVDGSRAR